MRTKQRATRISIKHSLTAIAVGSLLAVPALAFGAINPSPQAPIWDYPATHGMAPEVSRAEVLKQLLQAKRRGNYVINYETGQTAYQADPSAFPAHPHQPYKTRAQVLRALKKAERTGNYVIDAETGQLANQTSAG